MLSWLKCSRTYVRSAFNPHDALPAGLIRGFEIAYPKLWLYRKANFVPLTAAFAPSSLRRTAVRLAPRGLRALNWVF
jgi:hypothetical protein